MLLILTRKLVRLIRLFLLLLPKVVILLPKIYSLYDLPPSNAVIFEGETMTQQHFKDECDINNIMARYKRTGLLVDPLAAGTAQPQFGDFSNVEDYHSAQTIIAHANQAFDQLPSSLRKRFENDPAQLLAFLEDESNREEAVKLGIVLGTSSTTIVDNPAAGITAAPDPAGGTGA